jgi:hypothetical protein
VGCISKESSDTDSISSRTFQEEMRDIYASWKDGIYPIRSFPYRPLQTATTTTTAAGIAFKKVQALLNIFMFFFSPFLRVIILFTYFLRMQQPTVSTVKLPKKIIILHDATQEP